MRDVDNHTYEQSKKLEDALTIIEDAHVDIFRRYERLYDVAMDVMDIVKREESDLKGAPFDRDHISVIYSQEFVDLRMILEPGWKPNQEE